MKLKNDEVLSNFAYNLSLRRYSTGPKQAVTIREEGFAEMESFYRRGQGAIDELKEIAKTLRRLPVAELESPTVVG